MISLAYQKKFSTKDSPFTLDVALQVGRGEVVALYGPSGSGKTTIFRLMTGLLPPDNGFLSIDDRYLYHAARKINKPPQQRRIGYVFQDYALFPSKTVWDNIRFALSNRRDVARVQELVELMELQGLERHKPAQLSGGQQQRVALARALAQQPEVLLLDEPLAALDPPTRRRLQNYLQVIQKRYALTILLISHDLDEIMELADRVYTINQGRIVDSGPPARLAKDPLAAEKLLVEGTITALQRNGPFFCAAVSASDQVFTVPIAASDYSALQVGANIVLTTSILQDPR